MIIREAEGRDAGYIAEISTDALGYACKPDLVQKRLTAMDGGRQKVFVAVEDDKVVGFLQAELYQLLYQEDKINVLGLAVDRTAQRKGYGTELMHAAEAWGKELNCASVRLNSASGRTDAHYFYEALGYQNTKSQKRFVKEL